MDRAKKHKIMKVVAIKLCGKTNKEIGEILGCRPERVRQWLHLGVKIINYQTLKEDFFIMKEYKSYEKIGNCRQLSLW